MEATDNHINYIEFTAPDLDLVKEFYSQAFGWSFTDYGPDYVAFADSGLEGGFARAEEAVVNGALVLLFHHDLQLCYDHVVAKGGRISREIFSFPGGRRFHFTDPAGNELVVWSDK